MNTIYQVTTPNGDNVNEYFDKRESAANFIIDEFALAMLYHTDNESEKLHAYMMRNNETPNQYPYKYLIKEIKINHEYDM